MTYSLRVETPRDGDIPVCGASGTKVYQGRSCEPMVLHTDVEALPTAADAPDDLGDIQGRSLTQIALRRIRRDKLAVACFFILLAALLIAAFSGVINHLMGNSITAFHENLISNNGGLPIGRLGGVSWKHPFGVEPGTGRDLFARLLVGSKYSFIIAFSSTFVTVFLGVVVGAIAGYAKGWLDGFLGRLMDLILSFPLILILLALSNVLVQRLQSTFHVTGNTAEIVYIAAVLSLFGWPYLARVVRGQVLSLREREFVEASISLGAPTRRVLFREILPNLWAPILVYSTLLLPSYIAAEATLAYLGVGLTEPTPSWGAMLEASVTYFNVDPFFLFVPGVYLFVVVLAFNLLGDAVRDALDPRAGRS
jgi:peptide/nickel transport system permease protein